MRGDGGLRLNLIFHWLFNSGEYNIMYASRVSFCERSQKGGGCASCARIRKERNENRLNNIILVFLFIIIVIFIFIFSVCSLYTRGCRGILICFSPSLLSLSLYTPQTRRRFSLHNKPNFKNFHPAGPPLWQIIIILKGQ